MLENSQSRRKFPRFAPSREFFVYVKSGERFLLGRLVDISLGGLSLECLSECDEQDVSALGDTTCDLGIFLSSRQFFLSEVRSSLIYSREQDKAHYSFLGSRFKRCGLCFDRLDEAQAEALSRFMQMNQLISLD